MKRMYNRINRLYGHITSDLVPKLEVIVDRISRRNPDLENASVLEYACGTGHLSLLLASKCRSLTARDVSSGMLEIARERTEQAGVQVTFSEGDLLAVDEADASFDYVAVSFALHLFPVETEIEILRQLCRVARKGVFIIDHERRWRPLVALVEWFEGGYYDQFIGTDFSGFHRQVGAMAFDDEEIATCRVMTFSTSRSVSATE